MSELSGIVPPRLFWFVSFCSFIHHLVSFPRRGISVGGKVWTGGGWMDRWMDFRCGGERGRERKWRRYVDNRSALEGGVNEGGRRGMHRDRKRREKEGGKERDKERLRWEEGWVEVWGGDGEWQNSEDELRKGERSLKVTSPSVCPSVCLSVYP